MNNLLTEVGILQINSISITAGTEAYRLDGLDVAKIGAVLFRKVVVLIHTQEVNLMSISTAAKSNMNM